MIELFECVPLSARISRIQCKINRTRQNDHKTGMFAVIACKGCKGLGSSTIIDLEEVVVAKQCKVDGCNKLSQYNTDGMCKAHFSKSKKGAAMVAVPAEVIDESDWQQQIIPEMASFGTVTNAEGDQVSFGTDPVVVLALREAWAEKEREWLVELSGLKPGATIMRAVDMVDALQSLVY